MTITTKLGGVRFSLQATIEDRYGVPGIKDLKVYCIDKHKDISEFLSNNAIFLFKAEIGKILDIDDIEG